MEENEKVIEQLAQIYEKMNTQIEHVQNLIEKADYNKDELIGYYKEINNSRKEAQGLLSKYKATDNLAEINNMKALRKGFLNIINTAKASMLSENSYENQRSINKISLDTLIPVLNFKFHHADKLNEEIFILDCFIELENIYEQQVDMVNTQLEKSKEIKESLRNDSNDINILLNDCGTANNIYDQLSQNGLLINDYAKLFIEINEDENNILVQIENKNGERKQFNASFRSIENLSKKRLTFNEEKATQIEVDEDNIILMQELNDIDNNITKNLNDLEDTMLSLNNKLKQLDEDKKALDVVRDDFMKNGTEGEDREGKGLRLGTD